MSEWRYACVHHPSLVSPYGTMLKVSICIPTLPVSLYTVLGIAFPGLFYITFNVYSCACVHHATRRWAPLYVDIHNYLHNTQCNVRYTCTLHLLQGSFSGLNLMIWLLLIVLPCFHSQSVASYFRILCKQYCSIKSYIVGEKSGCPVCSVMYGDVTWQSMLLHSCEVQTPTGAMDHTDNTQRVIT